MAIEGAVVWPATGGCLIEYLIRGWFLVVFFATPLLLNCALSTGTFRGISIDTFSRVGVVDEMAGNDGGTDETPPIGMARGGLVLALAAYTHTGERERRAHRENDQYGCVEDVMLREK